MTLLNWSIALMAAGFSVMAYGIVLYILMAWDSSCD
jgi:hypothetical protein